MSNGDNQPAQEAQPQQQKIQIHDSGSPTHYANFFTVSASPEAVLLSFASMFGGNNMVQVESKVALSLTNTKRLALTLGQVIRRYEEERGEIDLGKPAQTGGAAPK